MKDGFRLRTPGVREIVAVLLGLASIKVSYAIDNPPLVVRVKPTATIASTLITLGAVAQIEGDEPSCQRARGLTLGYAPEVGVPRLIRREAIWLALAAADFASEQVRLEAPAEIAVYRAAQQIAAERIAEAVRQALIEATNFKTGITRLRRLDLPGHLSAVSGETLASRGTAQEGAREKINPLSERDWWPTHSWSGISVPAGQTELRVTYNKQQNLLLPFTVVVEIAVDGQIVKRLPLTAQLEVHARVAIAGRHLAANERLNPDTDVSFEIRRLTGRLSDYITEAQSLRGKSVRRPVAAGQALTADMFFNDLLVRRGDEVKIIAESERMSIITRGEAQAAGRLGERIQVRNLQTKALLQGEVIDEGVVKVSF